MKNEVKKVLALIPSNKCSNEEACGAAELVYGRNHDGTYHILKNRDGIQGNDITATELIALLTNIINDTYLQ